MIDRATDWVRVATMKQNHKAESYIQKHAKRVLWFILQQEIRLATTADDTLGTHGVVGGWVYHEPVPQGEESDQYNTYMGCLKALSSGDGRVTCEWCWNITPNLHLEFRFRTRHNIGTRDLFDVSPWYSIDKVLLLYAWAQIVYVPSWITRVPLSTCLEGKE